MAQSLELIFKAAVHSIVTGEEKHLATFYLMNTSENLNRWAVTDKSLEAGLPSLLNKPIGCGPGYKIDKHYAKPLDLGKWIKTDKPDGYALGTTDITDDTAWGKLKAGEWGPISVIITSYKETCSKCGEDLMNLRDPFKHDCIATKGAHLVVESFKFNRVDFIDEPAYPQADLTKLGAEACPECERLELLAGYYVSQSIEGQNMATDLSAFEGSPLLEDELGAFAKAPMDAPWDGNRARFTFEQLRRASAYVEPGCDVKKCCHLHHHNPNGTLVWRGVVAAAASLGGARDGYQGPGKEQARKHLTAHYHAFDRKAPWEPKGQAAGSPGVSPNPEEKRKMSEKKLQELEATVKELNEKIETIEAAAAAAAAVDGKDPKDPKTDDDDAVEKDPRVAELEEKVKAMEDEKHKGLLEAAVNARFEAGLVTDTGKAREDLKELPDAVLALMAQDAEKVKTKMSEIPTVPRTKYTATGKSAFDEAVEGHFLRLHPEEEAK